MDPIGMIAGMAMTAMAHSARPPVYEVRPRTVIVKQVRYVKARSPRRSYAAPAAGGSQAGQRVSNSLRQITQQ